MILASVPSSINYVLLSFLNSYLLASGILIPATSFAVMTIILCFALPVGYMNLGNMLAKECMPLNSALDSIVILTDQDFDLIYINFLI